VGTFRQGVARKLGESHALAQQLAELQADLAGWVARTSHPPAASAPSPRSSEGSFAFAPPAAGPCDPQSHQAASTSDSTLPALAAGTSLLPAPTAHSAPLPTLPAHPVGASPFAALASSPYALQLSQARSSSGDGAPAVEVTVVGPVQPSKDKLSLSQAVREKLRLFSSKGRGVVQGKGGHQAGQAHGAEPALPGQAATGGAASGPKGSRGSATPTGFWASCLSPPEVLQQVQ
jgi:hypothetical protein